MSAVGDFLFGNSESPGLLGTGQFGAKMYDANKDAYYDNQKLDDLAQTAQAYGNQYRNRSAPTMTATTGTAAQGGAYDMTAQTGQSTNATAANLGTANLANAATGRSINSQAAMLGNNVNANAANIDQSQDQQFRNQQTALAGQLADAAAGKGPSLAQSQLGQANAAAAASRMSQAASQRGYGNTGATLRDLAYQQGAANQQNAIASAQTRIQEQQAAQQALGNVLASGRGADQNLATTQAGLSQQANLQNASTANQFLMQNVANQQQANLANQAAANQFGLANMQNQQQTNLANQGALNQFALQQGEYNQAANMQNAAAANQFGLANLGYQNQAAANNQAAQNNVALANLGYQNQMNLANLGYQNQASTNNMNAYLNQEKLNQDELNAMFGFQTALTQQQMQNQQAYEELMARQQMAANGVNLQGYQGAAESRSNLIGGLGSAAVGLAMLSDEREKKSVKSTSKDDVNEFLNGMSLSPKEEKKNIYGVTPDNIDQFLSTSNFVPSGLTSSGVGQLPAVQNMDSPSGQSFDYLVTPKDLMQKQQAEQAQNQQANQLAMNNFAGGGGGTGYQQLGNSIAQAGLFSKLGGASAAGGAGGGMQTDSLTGLSGSGEVAMSDKKEKKSKKPVDKKEVSDFINNIHGYKYDYKHPGKMGADDKTHFSPMAQDLEKSDIGKSMVYDVNGTKMVDYARGFGALMAVTAQINDRLKKIEKGRK